MFLIFNFLNIVNNFIVIDNKSYFLKFMGVVFCNCFIKIDFLGLIMNLQYNIEISCLLLFNIVKEINIVFIVDMYSNFR